VASATNQDLLRIYRKVMAAKAAGAVRVTIDGYEFDMHAQGMCQRNARQTFEAATGKPMPGKETTAAKTQRNLHNLADGVSIIEITDSADLVPGDFVYLSEGTVGHVGMYVDAQHIFQDTSRDGLGITDENFTHGQWGRFIAAYRLLPLAPDAWLDLLWGLVVDAATGSVLGSINVRGMHDATGRVYYDPTTASQYPPQSVPAGILDESDIWGLLVSLVDGSVTAPILPSGVDRLSGRIYVNVPA
jgi:hypothetical protein